MRFACVLALIALLAAPLHAERPAGDEVGTQVKGALLGMGVGGGIGVLFGLGFGGKDKAEAVGIGAAMCGLIGITVGVQKYADSEGGTGRWYGTVLGGMLGMGAAAATVYGERKSDDSPDKIIATVLIMAGAIIGGPIIGYRITQNEREVTTPVMLSGTF